MDYNHNNAACLESDLYPNSSCDPSCNPPYKSDDELRPEPALETPPDNSCVRTPTMLRSQPTSALPGICTELRHTLIESVANSGGHFAASLGVVELTVALHYTFNTPDEKLLWDVGHQSYVHKILTGRVEQMNTIRQYGGLSGFPVIDESPYDAFGAAHAGNSISAGLGFAAGMKSIGGIETQQQHSSVVCVLGDGALTEGMVFEALNHAGASDINLTVVLNDNGMSISPNVGALSTASSNKHAAFFRALGCGYEGPVDGHDVNVLINALHQIKHKPGINVLHVFTEKGKGYEPAENDPVGYHAVPQFNPEKGVIKSTKVKAMTYTDVFGRWLCDVARKDERVQVITPAMETGSGLQAFHQEFADRFHDVAIAEQHAVTFAAGMACTNKKPVVAIYSSFLQRAYDQVIHDVALQDLDVLFAIDRGGLVGNDGATHHGSFDLSFLRCIPNMTIMAPSNEKECRLMLQTGLMHQGPAAVRYERGSGPGITPSNTLDTIPIGQAEVIEPGQGIALLAFGSMVEPSVQAAAQLGATVVNMRFIKPIDETILLQLASEHQVFVTLENNAIAGGAGSAVNEAVNRLQLPVRVMNLGLPDNFIEHGSQAELLQQCQLDAIGIVEQIEAYVKSLPANITSDLEDKTKLSSSQRNFALI